MHLRGVDYGHVIASSGTRGFFDERYWYHDLPPWKYASSALDRTTFVAKTVTLHPNEGNMPLRSDWQPKELFPACIIVKPLHRETKLLRQCRATRPNLRTLFCIRRMMEP